MNESMIRCSNCGQTNQQAAVSCVRCGKGISEPSTRQNLEEPKSPEPQKESVGNRIQKINERR